ncbi:pleckstrin homology domain-containing family A member 5-like, partial [Clarias magur]
MAADPNPDWLSCLPSSWSYGVIRDGRVFFINEEAKSTTWLHPVSGEAVITGHRKTPDLPTGWEEGYTFEGARCFINEKVRVSIDSFPRRCSFERVSASGRSRDLAAPRRSVHSGHSESSGISA